MPNTKRKKKKNNQSFFPQLVTIMSAAVVPCPYCNRTFAPNGVNVHIGLVHPHATAVVTSRLQPLAAQSADGSAANHAAGSATKHAAGSATLAAAPAPPQPPPQQRNVAPRLNGANALTEERIGNVMRSVQADKQIGCFYLSLSLSLAVHFSYSLE